MGESRGDSKAEKDLLLERVVRIREIRRCHLAFPAVEAGGGVRGAREHMPRPVVKALLNDKGNTSVNYCHSAGSAPMNPDSRRPTACIQPLSLSLQPCAKPQGSGILSDLVAPAGHWDPQYRESIGDSNELPYET